MEIALVLTESQTERLRSVAESERATTYEVVFLALEEYLSAKEYEHSRAGAPRRAERRRELLAGFAGIECG